MKHYCLSIKIYSLKVAMLKTASNSTLTVEISCPTSYTCGLVTASNSEQPKWKIRSKWAENPTITGQNEIKWIRNTNSKRLGLWDAHMNVGILWITSCLGVVIRISIVLYQLVIISGDMPAENFRVPSKGGGCGSVLRRPMAAQLWPPLDAFLPDLRVCVGLKH